jgi:hypothetical protein
MLWDQHLIWFTHHPIEGKANANLLNDEQVL